MTTDPTIGSSGDATPIDLTARLHADLDDRATRVTVSAPPLSDILHRSRRRRARRHAAGIVAGAGALAIAGVAVVARPEPGTEITTAADSAPSGTTPPGTIRADLRLEDGGGCPTPGAWYLGLPEPASLAHPVGSSTVYYVTGGAWQVSPTTSSGRRVQLYLTADGAVDGTAILLSRSTFPTMVGAAQVDRPAVPATPGSVPVPPATVRFVAPATPATTGDGAAVTSRTVTVGGTEGVVVEWSATQAELTWNDGQGYVRLIGHGISATDLAALANRLQRRGDGGYDVPDLPAGLTNVVDTDLAGPITVGQVLSYVDGDRAINITTETITHDEFLTRVVELPGQIEHRQIRGHEGWIVGGAAGGQVAIWYDEARGAMATVSVYSMSGAPTTGALDEELGRLTDLDAGQVAELCAKLAADRAAAAKAAVPPPADGSSSPWTGDGSSSPWTGDGSSSPWTGDGSSSPWTGDGSSSPWVDPAPTTQAGPSPTVPPLTTAVPTSDPPPVAPTTVSEVPATSVATTTSIAPATTATTTATTTVP